jgi:hypothetical protein
MLSVPGGVNSNLVNLTHPILISGTIATATLDWLPGGVRRLNVLRDSAEGSKNRFRKEVCNER